MKILFWFYLSILTLSAEITAQPYIYYTISTEDTILSVTKLPDGKEKLDQYALTNTAHQKRFDLKNNIDEDFPPGENLSKDYSIPVWDPGQSYIDYFTYRRNTICQCAEPSNFFFFEDSTGLPVDELLYSNSTNSLYIFYDDYQRLNVVDLFAKKIISELKIPGYVDINNLMHPQRNTFFSSDGSKIYFYSRIPGTRTGQVWTYSLSEDEIVSKRNLSDLGYLASEVYELTFGSKGKGIITSYSKEPSVISYYRVYDFDTETGSKFIKNDDGFSEAYFIGTGNLMLIMNTESDSSGIYFHNGTIKVYKAGNGERIKTLHYPPGGFVYTFDNYPDDLYYVINIESPDRQIIRINSDTLLAK